MLLAAGNERLGFRYLDSTLLAVPNVPWPALPGRGRVVTSDPRRIEDLQLYLDHRETAAARHVVLAERRRMFRSGSLAPHQIDLLYSEPVCVPF
ncbi:hypothetical protein AB0G04_06995 [Actinoplanes sp. NPDC023801]|uniref:hypothetical protein n=1 Tax=Actinoplanes sp. NPDC023801 TaxID=3154595 RepID=UPI0033D7368C